MNKAEDLLSAISDLVGEFGSIHNTDYVMQLIATSIELGSDKTSTLDLKIASSALKEMREAFAMFQPYTHRPKVTIFGSARTKRMILSISTLNWWPKDSPTRDGWW